MTGRRFGSQPTGPPERYGRPQRSRVQLGGSARVTSPWGPAALWSYFAGSLASLWGACLGQHPCAGAPAGLAFGVVSWAWGRTS